MTECSLCKAPLEFEGGFVLFTDSHGKSFEVCGKCVGYIVLFHNPSNEEDKNRALDYISGYKANIGNQSVYDELMRFLKEEAPEKAPEPKYKPADLKEAVATLQIQEDALKEEAEYYNERRTSYRSYRFGGWSPGRNGKGSTFQIIIIVAIIIIELIIRILDLMKT